MSRRPCSVTLAQCEARYGPLLSRVARDLAPWESTGITDGMVAARLRAVSTVGDDLVVGSRNGTLAVAKVRPRGHKGRGVKSYAHIKAALETVCDVPDGDLVYSTSDHAPQGLDDPGGSSTPEYAPLHIFCVRASDRLSVAAPEASSFGTDYDAVVADLRATAPTKTDSTKLWFAGKISGPGNEARAAAGRLAAKHPDLFDVRLTSGDARVALEDQCARRYALYLHGSACSGRLKRLVHCGSALVFPRRAGGVDNATYEEFFYDRLVVPGETVVPAADVADLVRGMTDVRDDPEPAARIAAELAARATELNDESVACYWAYLFRENARLRRKGSAAYAAAQTATPRRRKRRRK